MRLGIYGGTFDPIHIGHLRIAEEGREQMGLDRVLFVPNQVSPFKTDRTVTPGAARLEMVRLAIAGNPAFTASDIEIRREGPSYAVETLRALQGEFPGAELFFLTGADAIRDLPDWREPEALLLLARFVGATRPGSDRDEVLLALPESWRARITFIEMPGLDISGTNLRERVQAGRSIRYLVPAAVGEYINRHGLYAEPEGETTA